MANKIKPSKTGPAIGGIGAKGVTKTGGGKGNMGANTKAKGFAPHPNALPKGGSPIKVSGKAPGPAFKITKGY